MALQNLFSKEGIGPERIENLGSNLLGGCYRSVGLCICYSSLVGVIHGSDKCVSHCVIQIIDFFFFQETFFPRTGVEKEFRSCH